MTTRLFISLLSVVVSTVLIGAPKSQAQTIDEKKAAGVKAAYLYQFAKFIEWPPDSFAGDENPIVIGVLGSDPFGSILDRTVKGKTVKNRGFVIKRFKFREGDNAAALRRCHILYISPSENSRIKAILRILAGSNVFVAGEGKDFAPAGGMIGLVFEDGRITFQINREATDRTKLKLSAKLLRLAQIVPTAGGKTSES